MPGPKITIRVDDRALVKLIKKSSGKGPVAIVADGVEYGLFQEMGTHEKRGGVLGALGFKGAQRAGAQPFMRPAAERVRPGFNKAFTGVLTIEQADQVVRKTAFDIERIAKDLAPVDTGALKNSIHVVTGKSFSVTFEQLKGGERIE